MTVMEAAKNLRESNSSYVSMLDSALPSFHYDYDLYHQKSLNSTLPQKVVTPVLGSMSDQSERRV